MKQMPKERDVLTEVDDIEYDDDAIFSENPRLQEHIIRFETSRYQWSPILKGTVMKRSFTDNVNNTSQENAVRSKTAELLAKFREEIRCIQTTHHGLTESRRQVRALKADFNKLQKDIGRVEKLHEKVIGQIRTERNNLQLIAYQNSVLRYLKTAAEHMKVLQMHVTPDKRIYFYDPADPGTDVDEAYMSRLEDTSDASKDVGQESEL